MYHGSRIAPKGFTRVHHFFFPRAAQAMGTLWEKAMAHPHARIRAFLLFMVEQAIWGMSVLARYAPTHFSQVNQYLNGVYYVASQHAECSPWYILDGKLDRLVKAFQSFRVERNSAMVTTGTAARMPLPAKALTMSSQIHLSARTSTTRILNLLVESWHGATTDAKPEAIMDGFKNKALPEYQHLMQQCFAEYYRVLKPGRWMTVVLSNSKASV